MKLILIALALTCSLAAASPNSTVSSSSTVSWGEIFIINNCKRRVAFAKVGWFLPAGSNAYKFMCDATEGVNTETLKSKEQRHLTPWFRDNQSNYINFWNGEVPVYTNRKRCSLYSYDGVVGNARSTCEDDPPNTGFVYVEPGQEYHLCRW